MLKIHLKSKENIDNKLNQVSEGSVGGTSNESQRAVENLPYENIFANNQSPNLINRQSS